MDPLRFEATLVLLSPETLARRGLAPPSPGLLRSGTSVEGRFHLDHRGSTMALTSVLLPHRPNPWHRANLPVSRSGSVRSEPELSPARSVCPITMKTRIATESPSVEERFKIEEGFRAFQKNWHPDGYLPYILCPFAVSCGKRLGRELK